MLELNPPRSIATPTLLAFPFRPFFLLAALYGAALVAAWLAFLFAGLPLPLGVNPAQWHGHEMLFGFVPAAIAGFLLTAMCNWTGAPPLAGRPLAALILLWLAGRLALWGSGLLPPWLVALADLSFLPVLAAYVGKVLMRHGNHRNLVLVGMLSLLTLANVFMHVGFAGIWPAGAAVGEVLALDLIAVIIVVIGGRITPAFTANWLRLRGGSPELVRRSERLDAWAMRLTLLMVPADLAFGWPWLGALAAAAAALVNAWRLWQWRGWRAAAEPLLWILHLGMAWIVLALSLKAATPLLGLSPAAWMHALGAGAMGTLIFGVMTRVSLGHTGRPLRLPRGARLIYWSVLLAGVARLATAFGLGDYRGGLLVSAAAWVLACVAFLALYWPILSGPRADGRPG